MRKTQIIVLGSTGRLGRLICEQARAPKSTVVLAGEIHSKNFVQIEAILRAALKKKLPTILVDVSLPSVTMQLLEVLKKTRLNVPLVVGCTGFESQQIQKLRTYAKKNPVLLASNFSLGVNLLFEIMRTYGQKLQQLGYEPKIHEVHHAMKRDQPSGTAKTLAQQLVNPDRVKITSERIGDVVGTHAVSFAGLRDELRFEHVAHDRRLFAEGAIFAAAWLAQNQCNQKPLRGKPFLSLQSALFG